MPRYVILRHETPPHFERPAHWDLMLEQGGALATWALGQAPAAGLSLKAEKLPDHRLAYLDYEGPISQNRGAVSRWDYGTYAILNEGAGELKVQLESLKAPGCSLIAEISANRAGALIKFAKAPASGTMTYTSHGHE